jgi:SAM-dependent methyltransferase
MRACSLSTNRDYLTGQLYADNKLLAIRIATHRRYTVPRVDMVQWALDLLPWRGDERVLDVGCGDGLYVPAVAERLTGPGRYLAGDLSLGILRELPHGVPAVNADAVALPAPAGSCDVVLANHMLYHVSDTGRAVAECHRVLCEGGQLLAVTNSQTSMGELVGLMREGYDRLGISPDATPDHVIWPFALENGQAVLSGCFDQVERHVLRSALVFPESAPLLAYLDSTRSLYEPGLPGDVAWDDLMRVWDDLISAHIMRHEAFRVNKVIGAFVAVKRQSA